mmetsp:Transcript_30123/g.65755  ORF Transcript_30123/g.65755 Transcript_30123/m.65755 type:complete len:82 (+) Transcript_30123:750-995(+)
MGDILLTELILAVFLRTRQERYRGIARDALLLRDLVLHVTCEARPAKKMRAFCHYRPHHDEVTQRADKLSTRTFQAFKLCR